MSTTKEESGVSDKIVAFKGFDQNWKCRDFQYAIGETYTHSGKVEPCNSGFHACEYPLDVFGYYAPYDSKFAVVEQSGEIEKHSGDSKIASSTISIKAEIDIAGMVKAAVEYITTRTKPVDGSHGTEDRSAATNTGDRSAATNTGDWSAATNTGDRSAATNTGDRSAASVEGTKSVAIATGYESKAKACAGSAIVLVNRDNNGNIRHIRASKVGYNGVKPDLFYMLDANGNFAECE